MVDAICYSDKMLNRKRGSRTCEGEACILKCFLYFQIFVGKIPRDLFEDELVPLFEKAGPIWDLRLMMDPLSGLNRGYAFVTFCTKEAAQEAVKLVSSADLSSPLKNKLEQDWSQDSFSSAVTLCKNSMLTQQSSKITKSSARVKFINCM